MSGTHSIDAHDAHGNRYRLTIHRESMDVARPEAVSAATIAIPIDIIGPRGEWVSLMHAGRYLLKPHDKDRAAIELYSDEPAAP
jgi:hypothetical protein